MLVGMLKVHSHLVLGTLVFSPPNTKLVIEELNSLTMKFLNIQSTLSYHSVPPRMPPRFSPNTNLPSGVNAHSVSLERC
jgi:hypothetical protein